MCVEIGRKEDLELLARAVADDLDEDLLVGADALHGVAQRLRILIGMDVLYKWKSF